MAGFVFVVSLWNWWCWFLLYPESCHNASTYYACYLTNMLVVAVDTNWATLCSCGDYVWRTAWRFDSRYVISSASTAASSHRALKHRDSQGVLLVAGLGHQRWFEKMMTGKWMVTSRKMMTTRDVATRENHRNQTNHNDQSDGDE